MTDATAPLTLGESLPLEQARVRALIPLYREIGKPGRFAIAMMENALSRAESAIARNDINDMLRAHHDLKGFHE